MQQITKSQLKYIARVKNNALFRKKEGKVYIEGEHNVLELIQNKPNLIDTVLKREDAAGYSQLNSIADKVFELNKIQAKKLSYGKKPFVLAALININNVSYTNADFSKGLYIGLVNVQDPFNLGTIFRTAQAFGVNGVIMFDNCVNPFNQKVVISSTGSVFKVPFYTFDSIVEFINKNKNVDVYGTAVPDSEKQDLTGRNPDSKDAAPRLSSKAGYHVVIQKEELATTEESKTNNSHHELPKSRQAGDSGSLDLTPYTNLQIENGIILFGNEGTGLSQKVLNISKQNIYVPIKTDSLNVAVSVAVIIAKLTEK